VPAGVVTGLGVALLGVASSLFTPQRELWQHLADTQLADIFANTLVLLLVVGLGTTIIGTGTAWLVTMSRFPGSHLLQWALLLPLVLPTYIIGYAYADLLAFAGPAQAALRAATGWGRGDYWFPDLGSAGGVALLFTLVLYPYVYLAARTVDVMAISHVLPAGSTGDSAVLRAAWASAVGASGGEEAPSAFASLAGLLAAFAQCHGPTPPPEGPSNGPSL
jgi:iron(III) transport system permease protein